MNKYDFEDLPLLPTQRMLDFLVYAIVEQPQNSTKRTVWDDTRHEFVETGLVMDVPLPAPYGWIPQTLSAGDNDALDVLILTEQNLGQGAYLAVRPIGVLLREDQDHKILAVDVEDNLYGRVHDYMQLQEHIIASIENWFRPYFKLNGWQNASEARNMIEQDHARFNTNPKVIDERATQPTANDQQN